MLYVDADREHTRDYVEWGGLRASESLRANRKDQTISRGTGALTLEQSMALRLQIARERESNIMFLNEQVELLERDRKRDFEISERFRNELEQEDGKPKTAICARDLGRGCARSCAWGNLCTPPGDPSMPDQTPQLWLAKEAGSTMPAQQKTLVNQHSDVKNERGCGELGPQELGPQEKARTQTGVHACTHSQVMDTRAREKDRDSRWSSWWIWQSPALYSVLEGTGLLALLPPTSQLGSQVDKKGNEAWKDTVRSRDIETEHHSSGESGIVRERQWEGVSRYGGGGGDKGGQECLHSNPVGSLSGWEGKGGKASGGVDRRSSQTCKGTGGASVRIFFSVFFVC
jgi:hypothetical protein